MIIHFNHKLINTDELPESKIIFDHIQEDHALEINFTDHILHIGSVMCKEYGAIIRPNTPDKPVDITLYDIYILSKIVPLSQWRYMDLKDHPHTWRSINE